MVILSTGIAILDACSVWLVIVSFHTLWYTKLMMRMESGSEREFGWH